MNFSQRKQIGLGFVAFPEFGSFFKAVDEKTLFQVPMMTDGRPATDNDDLNTVEVDFFRIDEQAKAECQQILAELLANPVQGDDFWNGVKIPQFVQDLIKAGKAKNRFELIDEPISGFNLTAHDGTPVMLVIQPEDEEERERHYLLRFAFVNPITDPDGDMPKEFENEAEAAEYAQCVVYGEKSE